MPIIRYLYLLSQFCYKPTLPDTWKDKFLGRVQWEDIVNRGFSFDPLFLSVWNLFWSLCGLMTPPLGPPQSSWSMWVEWRMPHGPCQVKGGRSLVGAGLGSRSLKAEHMASNRERVLLNRLGYLLFSAPWEFKNAAPWLNNGNCYVARLSQ